MPSADGDVVTRRESYMSIEPSAHVIWTATFCKKHGDYFMGGIGIHRLWLVVSIDNASSYESSFLPQPN